MALEEIRDHTLRDADLPELRAQNECNYRRALHALAKPVERRDSDSLEQPLPDGARNVESEASDRTSS